MFRASENILAVRTPIEKLHRRAWKAFKRRGWHHHADDGAQTVALNYLRNPESKQTVDQAVTDYIRSTIGRYARAIPEHHIAPHGKAGPIRPSEEVLSGKMDAQFSVPPSQGQEDALLARLGREDLSVQERSSLVLYFRWGLELHEIGDVFGVSEASACNYIKRALRKLGVSGSAKSFK